MLRGKFLLTDLTARAPWGQRPPAAAAAPVSRRPRRPVSAARQPTPTIRRGRPNGGSSWSIGPRARWPRGKGPASGFRVPRAWRTASPLARLRVRARSWGKATPRAGSTRYLRAALSHFSRSIRSPRPLAGEHAPGASPRPYAGEGLAGAAKPAPRPTCGFRPPDAQSPALRRPAALQVHNRYLVTESDDGVTIIDQHALHERILYEHLRRTDRGRRERDAGACSCPSRSI